MGGKPIKEQVELYFYRDVNFGHLPLFWPLRAAKKQDKADFWPK